MPDGAAISHEWKSGGWGVGGVAAVYLSHVLLFFQRPHGAPSARGGAPPIAQLTQPAQPAVLANRCMEAFRLYGEIQSFNRLSTFSNDDSVLREMTIRF